MENDQIEILLSKNKLWLSIIASLLFVMTSTWLLTVSENIDRFNPVVIKGIAISGIVLFGITAVFGIKKLFDKKAGLIINEVGIYDNTTGVSAGLIEWKDIIEIRMHQIMSTKFVSIFVHNPDKYILKAKNKMKAKIMKANMNMNGTPISISPNTLKCNFDDLNELLVKSFEKYKL